MDAKTAAQIALVAIDYEDAFNALNAGLKKARDNPSGVTSRDWIIDMGIVVAGVRAAGQKMRAIKCADETLEVSIKAMTDAYDEAMADMARGIDERNAAIVVGASRKIARGDTFLSRIIEEIKS